MSCAPARCSNCSRPRDCGPEAVHRTRLRVGEGLVGTHRRERPPAGAGRCAVASGFRLSPGNRRGDLPLADGRADPARRPGARGPRRAEPDAAAIHRGRDRDAADDRDDRRRAGRQRRTGQPARDGGKPPRRRAADAARRDPPQSGAGGCPGGAARAEDRDPPGRRRGCRGRGTAAARRGRRDAAGRSTGWSMRAAGSGRASTAKSSKPTACSRPIAAGSPASPRRCAAA